MATQGRKRASRKRAGDDWLEFYGPQGSLRESQLDSSETKPARPTFKAVARWAGWAPLPQVGYEDGAYCSGLIPLLKVKGTTTAKKLVEALQRNCDHADGPRFFLLTQSDLHEQLSIEWTARQNQAATGAVRDVADMAIAYHESLLERHEPDGDEHHYLFCRFFPGLNDSFPYYDNFINLDRDDEAASEFEKIAQEWWAEHADEVQRVIAARRKRLRPRPESDGGKFKQEQLAFARKIEVESALGQVLLPLGAAMQARQSDEKSDSKSRCPATHRAEGRADGEPVTPQFCQKVFGWDPSIFSRNAFLHGDLAYVQVGRARAYPWKQVVKYAKKKRGEDAVEKYRLYRACQSSPV